MKDLKFESLFGIDTPYKFSISHKDLATKNELNLQLSVCDSVVFPGFPEWHDKKNNLPIMRAGTIASHPAFNYSYKNQVAGDCIAYEAFSFGGSSGSPVIAVEKGVRSGNTYFGGGYRRQMVVGINAGHFLNEEQYKGHSGISYFYKSSCILDIID